MNVLARDRRLLQAAAFLRSTGVGLTGVLLGLYLARLSLTEAEIGTVVAGGLAGNAAGTFAAGWAADRAGRRRVLILLALLSALGMGALLAASGVFALTAAAFVGMANGMGRDRGPLAAIEQSALPATAPDYDRTRLFAWYNILCDAGHGLGALLAALPAVLTRWTTLAPAAACRGSLALVALSSLLGAALYLPVSPAVEAAGAGASAPLSPASRSIVARLAGLFALDALGGGFLSDALVTYYFFRRFNVDEAALGPFFFCCRIASAASYLVAERLARRIGLIRTMVWTHIPSSLILMAVPLVPGFGAAGALFLLRSFLAQMDVPTRQSYLMAVVRPEERSRASGATNLTRNVAWAAAPAAAGHLMRALSLSAPLIVGGSLKIAYDLLLFASFRSVRPPEERRA